MRPLVELGMPPDSYCFNYPSLKLYLILAWPLHPFLLYQPAGKLYRHLHRNSEFDFELQLPRREQFAGAIQLLHLKCRSLPSVDFKCSRELASIHPMLAPPSQNLRWRADPQEE